MTSSEDPVLVRGTCIQLGDLRVSPVRGVQAPAVVDTDLLRFLVYKDQWTGDWKKFTAGPLRALITHFPCLQYCDCSERQCPKFHPSIEETGFTIVVLDAFAWKWHDKDGKACSNAKAVAFTLMVRLPTSATPSLLQISGTDGLFTELRSDDNAKYAVVWVPGGLDDAKHLLRSNDLALRLVRFHSKYGLRCLKKDEAKVHAAVFPDRKFVDCGVALLYEVGPWPFGVTKNIIAEFLEAFEWTARPLRPSRSGSEGRYWIIGSSLEPPAMVATYADGFLTFSRVRDQAAPKPLPDVIASVKTLQRIATSSSSSTSGPVDLLQTHDPWKVSRPSIASGHETAAGSTKLDELEARLTNKMTEQLQEQFKSIQEEPMETSDSRIDKMELVLGEVQAQQAQFTQWCHTAADQISTLTKQVSQQDTRLGTIGQQVEANAAATQAVDARVGSLHTSVKTDLHEAMDKQMANIESLLSKKMRLE